MTSERFSFSLGQIESPTSSPRHSPSTSPQYSPFNFSWEPSPRWTPEAMTGSTPGLLWEIHDDAFLRFLHEYWAEENTMEVDHAEEELIPVERLVATSSIMDGATPQGVEVINNANNGDNTNGINNELNEVRIDGCSCSICYEACTSGGKHRICCLPCGHVYGLSCIHKWLPFHQGSNKDVRILYVTSQPTDDHETSLKNIISRMEALKLRVSTQEQQDDALEKLPTELERCVHALEECVHAIEASLLRVSIGTEFP
uniref:E3 ubiquitin-protein ligase RFWD3-like isoform X1 n=1 Tax=Tanacetum cinerariifolium TaxID=118510 RepID=A0A6L2MB01_TANCI|nr:E3 ubiquitin-protein ligase RFWD3-like isoform X1 [Tanacetum cinerariifolium]